MNYYIKEYRYKFANKLRSMSTRSPKQYRRFLNGITQKKKQKIDSPNIDTFYDYFKSTNTSDSDEEIDMSNLPINGNNNLNLDFTEEEINKCIDNLNNSKSPSPSDNIINEYIKTRGP